jgi:hypothetical protein
MEKSQAFKTVKAAFPVKANTEEKAEEEVHLKLRLLLSAKQMILENYPLPLGRPNSRNLSRQNFVALSSSLVTVFLKNFVQLLTEYFVTGSDKIGRILFWFIGW